MSVIINGTGGSGVPASPVGSVQYNAGGGPPNVFGGFGIYTPSTHTLELDAADSAAPNSQTLRFQGVVAGTTNTPGVIDTIIGSLSTGIGRPGSFSFNTGYVGYDVNKNVTISNGSPATLTTSVNHNLAGGQSLLLQTTGTLPTGLSTLTMYWVDLASITATTFELAASFNGAPINTSSAGSGTHSYVLGGIISAIANSGPGSTTVFVAPDLVSVLPGMQVQFQCTGVFPTNISPNTTYFIDQNISKTFFQVAATPGGTPITTNAAFTGILSYSLQNGGVEQNAYPPNFTPFLVGPTCLYANERTPFFNVQQFWNTTIDSQNVVGMAGLTFNINNVRFQTQNTVFCQFNLLDSNQNVFNIRCTPNGASNRIDGTSGVATPPFVDFSNDNLTDARLTLGGNPIVQLSLTGGSPPAVDGWLNYGGQARAASDFPVTSSTVLVNVTGLSVTVQAGRSYSFDVYLTCTDAAAGGVQAAIGGSCTATNIIYDGWALDNNVIKGQTNAAALGTAVASTLTTSTAGIVIRIKGLITVNAAGTLTVQFAQNTGNITASTVKRGSHFIVQDMP